jgi:Mrp family chromosome partitioning ATPase
MPGITRATALQRYIHYAEVKHVLDRLLMLQETLKFQSLAILSEYDGEGKTFVTGALAAAYMERLKRKVLIVDSATPRPISAPTSGSSLARQKNSALGDLLEESDHVDVISLKDWSGLKQGGNADEYRLKALFAQNASPYGLVLVDTSSLARKNRNNFDPILIARQCDAAILVSTQNELAENVSEENKKQLFGAGIKLIGMIHNNGEKQVVIPGRGGVIHGKQ